MDKLIIEATGLTKNYNGFTAVDNLDLEVRAGEVYGVLGPNGAGKTTSILMLLGLTEPTSGTISVVGFNPIREPLSVKSHVGYIPEQVGFYTDLTAWENLRYITRLNHLPRKDAYLRIEKALDRVGLSDVANQPVKTFSRGMKQRLGVADVLIKKPRLIIMDEPTQGLDPEQAHHFLQMIKSLKQEGTTILLASHLLHQVQAVCDRVGLFHRGKKVLEGEVSELARSVLGGAYQIFVEVENPTEKIQTALENVSGARRAVLVKSGIYKVEAEKDIRADLASAAIQSGAQLIRLDLQEQSLDEIYTKYFEEVENDVRSESS